MDFHIGELPDSPDSSVYAPSSETDSDDSEFGASWIETINVPNCPKQVHQPQHNHGRMDHGLQEINHGNVIGNIVGGDIRKTCATHQHTIIGGGCFSTKGSFTRDRWISVTQLGNIMTHTTFTQCNGCPPMPRQDGIGSRAPTPCGCAVLVVVDL